MKMGQVFCYVNWLAYDVCIGEKWCNVHCYCLVRSIIVMTMHCAGSHDVVYVPELSRRSVSTETIYSYVRNSSVNSHLVHRSRLHIHAIKDQNQN